ncbi:MAG: hypothetical protein ABI666_04195 [Ferruginibacter sp.]
MKYIVWILLSVNLYLGLRSFLNAVHVLHTSKYSQTATVLFAILFLAMGSAGVYLSLAKDNTKLALLVSIGPWVIALLFLLFNMMTQDYK